MISVHTIQYYQVSSPEKIPRDNVSLSRTRVVQVVFYYLCYPNISTHIFVYTFGYTMSLFCIVQTFISTMLV